MDPVNRVEGHRAAHTNPSAVAAHNAMRLLDVLLVLGAARAAGELRVYAAGSGMDMLSQNETVREVIDLANTTAPPRVLYVGTATYDEPGAREEQTAGFAARGCPVTSVDVRRRVSYCHPTPRRRRVVATPDKRRGAARAHRSLGCRPPRASSARPLPPPTSSSLAAATRSLRSTAG